MGNSWFIINTNKKTFESKIKAKNLEDAFNKSIVKWELIIDGYIQPKGTTDGSTCGLCDMFYNRIEDHHICAFCPINIISGYPECEYSPYEDWSTYYGMNNKSDILIARDFAKEELKLLKKLKKIYLGK